MHTMNTVTYLLQNTSLNDVPQSSNDTKSLLQMDAHLFKQWDSEGTPVLPCSQSVGVIWKKLGTGVSVDAQHQEKRQIEALMEKTVCGLLCVAQGGAAVSLQEAGLLPQHSHGCRFCGGGQNASELCLQGHIHNTCFGTTSGTDSWPSLILLSLLNPKGWRQEVNPQVMVTFSRGDLLKSASGRLCCRMAKWAGGFSAEHKENQ